MIMSPGVRKFALTVHVTTAVGWLGAVAGFLVLAVCGLTSHDPQLVRAVYVAMELLGWCLIVPLSFGSLLSGIIQGLGTPWGLLRHYWVLIKLLMTPLATLVLLVHMQPIQYLADVARHTLLSHGDLSDMRLQIVVDAAAGALVLLVATVLSVYKPRGLTAYGRRRSFPEPLAQSISATAAET